MSLAANSPVALVTGAGRGIGRAIAADLARDHRVIGTYRSNQAAAEQVAAEIGAEMVQSDIGDTAARQALVEGCYERYGRLDLLVNNAGMAPRQRADLLEASEESFDEVLATNLKGPYFLTQAVARRMVAAGQGRIVFITSISSYAASINRGEYCVSKAGLSMTTALYASRLAPEGVGVFEVRPGIIETDMIESVKGKYEKLAADGLLPQGRLGKPEDIARAVRAIADGLLDYAAGQALDVDGGFHLRRL